MNLSGFEFTVVNWGHLAPVRTAGLQGHADQRVMHFGNVRVRLVQYSEGYESDHWCKKGHVLLCVGGELITTLEDGREFKLLPGTSYQVADEAEAHRSRTKTGATLFIVD